MSTILARKRERSRDKLLIAAQELMLEQSAASLSIRDISARADMVHGSFYNYFQSVEELLQSVGLLFYAIHHDIVRRQTQGIYDYARIFAIATRQTLHFICHEPRYGHFMFDAGLPIDKYISGLRLTMRYDIEQGMADGRFKLDNIDLTVSIITGSIIGVALDLHRQILKPEAVNQLTARLLQQLGVDADEARQIAYSALPLIDPPQPPLSALALGSYFITTQKAEA